MKHLFHVWIEAESPPAALHHAFKDRMREVMLHLKPEVWPATFVPPNVVDLIKQVQVFHPEAWQVVFAGDHGHFYDRAGELVDLDLPLGDPRSEAVWEQQRNAQTVVRGLYPLPAAFTLPPGLSDDDRDLLRQTIDNLEIIEALKIEGVGLMPIDTLTTQLKKALK